MDIFDDLVAEQDRLEKILGGLPDGAWQTPSLAPGWTVRDVVLHLAQTEEAVLRSVDSDGRLPAWGTPGEGVDAAMDRMVRTDAAPPALVFDRWRRARRGAVEALRGTDPQRRLPWVANTLRPTTLATTRLAEHWAHGLDITGPLGIPFPDTDRLRHIAWLGHGSLPYAFRLAGQQPQEVYCELSGPAGEVWRYGPAQAPSAIVGTAGEFCRVGAQRLRPERSGLVTRGPYGPAALRVLRNYAG